jgi:predicted enzyme related to lactoylglutathione lyase
MTVESAELPVGMAGLRYGLTQISLAVRDLDTTMDLYYQAFGWAPWQVFDHVPPVHHHTELRGQPVDYSLRGAEVYVGSLNFELLQPLQGPNLWSEFMDRRGEGVASIATMFLEREDGDAVKKAFKDTFDIDVIMKANIGPHIEYYYLDTEEKFGCLIESGSGHAIDFVKPAKVHPFPGAEPGPSPISGITYPITQVSVTVRDLEAKMRAYHEAFGWGPWKIFTADNTTVMHDCEWKGKPARFNVHWAETMVGDLNFELIEPLGPGNPWQEFLDEKGEGISSVAVMFNTPEESERVKAQFAQQGIGVTAVGHIGDDIEWYFLDTELPFKCVIESGSGHALDFAVPHETYP